MGPLANNDDGKPPRFQRIKKRDRAAEGEEREEYPAPVFLSFYSLLFFCQQKIRTKFNIFCRHFESFGLTFLQTKNAFFSRGPLIGHQGLMSAFQ
jgi:hypothetical protein